MAPAFVGRDAELALLGDGAAGLEPVRRRVIPAQLLRRRLWIQLHETASAAPDHGEVTVGCSVQAVRPAHEQRVLGRVLDFALPAVSAASSRDNVDARGQARLLCASLQRLLELPDHVVLYPSHYGGSVCGRGLSGNPISSIGFERAHNPLLSLHDPEAFADALLTEAPPRPADQKRIVAANRSGRVGAPA